MPTTTVHAVVYRPAHQRQLVATDPHGKVNCAAVGLAIALDRATLGGLRVTGRLVRALSNEPHPDPDSPGLYLPQLRTVAAILRVPLSMVLGASWGALLTSLRAGRAVLLPGTYGALGEWSCQPSFRGGHMIVVNHVSGDGDLFIYDPLCSKAREVPAPIIREYAQSWGEHVGQPAGRFDFAVVRATPLVATVVTS